MADEFVAEAIDDRPFKDQTIMRLLVHWGKNAQAFEAFFSKHCASFDADCMVAGE